MERKKQLEEEYKVNEAKFSVDTNPYPAAAPQYHGEEYPSQLRKMTPADIYSGARDLP